jgi:hypothetical protein
MKRTPKLNSTFIKKHYKTSTIPRLEQYGYKKLKDINDCPIITEWLDMCYYTKLVHGYTQDQLFYWIRLNQIIENLRNGFSSDDEKISLDNLFPKLI